MRRFLFIALAVVAAAARAQTVTLVSPTTISIPVTGDRAQLRVFYDAPPAARVVVTGDGPIVAGKNIGFAPSTVTSPPSFVIEVRASRSLLRSGATHTAHVIFSGDGVTTTAFPVTITRPAVTFTATPSQTDICLGCGEPNFVTVKITNSGTTPLAKVKVGAVEMSDASRKHRVVQACKGAPKDAAARDDAGNVIMHPCSTASIAIEPGDTRTIAVAIEPPAYAGDYATTLELSAEGSATVPVSLVVRIRGPWGALGIPLLFFLVAVITGGVLAHILEYYFGSGGGETRATALISLHATSEQLEDLAREWDADTELPTTRSRLAADISQVNTLIGHAEQRAPAELTTLAADYAMRLEKRQRLRQKVANARASGKGDRVHALDKASDAGTVMEYEERLQTILEAEQLPAAELESQTVHDAQEKQRQQREKEAIKQRHRILTRLRWITLGLVSIATAYLALYYNKCSYGTVADYITAFFWGLGLTQAGNALTAEGRSKYTPPPAEHANGGG